MPVQGSRAPQPADDPDFEKVLQDALLNIPSPYRKGMAHWLRGYCRQKTAAKMCGLSHRQFAYMWRTHVMKALLPYKRKANRRPNYNFPREVEALREAGWVPGSSIAQMLHDLGFQMANYGALEINRIGIILTSQLRKGLTIENGQKVFRTPHMHRLPMHLGTVTLREGRLGITLPSEAFFNTGSVRGDIGEVRIDEKENIVIRIKVRRCNFCNRRNRPVAAYKRGFICTSCFETLRRAPVWEEAVNSKGIMLPEKTIEGTRKPYRGKKRAVRLQKENVQVGGIQLVGEDD